MSGSEWERIKKIFHAARPRSGTERERVLDELCGDDETLKARVIELIAADEEKSSLLDSRELDGDDVEPPPYPDPSRRIVEGPGDRIGPYKLLQEIGEGGFGVVYMAEQEAPIRRRVALKVIKPGMDTKQVIARFEAERQALAMMDHPNIAKVFDAGTTPSGRPYFVMELVKGIPITDYCDDHTLDTRERLGLFTDVCRAVEHAHQAGIIHRDLKPSNVLVTLHDGAPVPKVIDFGVAKATRARLTESTLFTEFHQFVGTPTYMSPEQATYEGLEVDTRSDVYSLGVLLYELLTGTTPFEASAMKRAAYFEVLRILKEEEPPKPSTRVSTMGGNSEMHARHRGADPGALAKMLRGDLDWIIMKALEKDRRRRYASASDMAADVSRYFEQKPIHARPPSRLYRAQKLLKRRRGRFAAAAVLLIALGVDVGYVTWQRARMTTDAGPSDWRDARHVLATPIESECTGIPLPSPDESTLAAWNWCEGGMMLVDFQTGEVEGVATDELIWSHAWAPDGRRIAVGVEDGTELRLHILDVASGELRLHEELASEDFAPTRWSPDGEWLAGRWRDADGDVSIALVSLESGERRILAQGVRRSDGPAAAFSPKGRYVVFSTFDGASEDLAVMDVASGDRWPLTSGPDDDVGALWSPDGEVIVYANEDGLWSLAMSDGRASGAPRLLRNDRVSPQEWTEHGFYYHVSNTLTRGHKVEVDPSSGRPTGRRETVELPEADMRDWRFRWAPLLDEPAEPDSGTPERMAVAGRGDGKIHLLTGGNEASFEVGAEVLPSNMWWSAGGRELLFTSSSQGQRDRSSRTVRALDVETGTLRTLASLREGVAQLHVSPDTRHMVSIQPEAGAPRQAMVVSRTGTMDGVVVARAGVDGDFSTQSGQPVFSPDGSRIVFQREFYDRFPDDGESSLWVVGSDGSGERRLVRAWGILSPPLWDPAGRMIAYVELVGRDARRGRTPDDESHLNVVSAEDGQVWEVLDLTDMGSPRLQDWSPDGRWIGFTERIGRHELWIDRDLLEKGIW